MSGDSLTDGFRDILELRWSEFRTLEGNPTQSNFDSVISAIVRACAKGNLRSIQMALDRMDGKVAMEVEVEMPKFYTLYPQARIAADDPSVITAPTQPTPTTTPAPDAEMPTGSLRAVLKRMMDEPKQIVADILATSEAVDGGSTRLGDPLVKSVIVAGLMKMVHEGRISAVFEVFEQLDGKVNEKIKMLGDDVYLTNYAQVAPAGAVLNEDGVYQLESPTITNHWGLRLEEGRKR